jgi:hypothetical protein
MKGDKKADLMEFYWVVWLVEMKVLMMVEK